MAIAEGKNHVIEIPVYIGAGCIGYTSEGGYICKADFVYRVLLEVEGIGKVNLKSPMKTTKVRLEPGDTLRKLLSAEELFRYLL